MLPWVDKQQLGLVSTGFRRLLLIFLMKILYVFHANDNVNQSLPGDGHRC